MLVVEISETSNYFALLLLHPKWFCLKLRWDVFSESGDCAEGFSGTEF